MHLWTCPGDLNHALNTESAGDFGTWAWFTTLDAPPCPECGMKMIVAITDDREVSEALSPWN